MPHPEENVQKSAQEARRVGEEYQTQEIVSRRGRPLPTSGAGSGDLADLDAHILPVADRSLSDKMGGRRSRGAAGGRNINCNQDGSAEINSRKRR